MKPVRRPLCGRGACAASAGASGRGPVLVQQLPADCALIFADRRRGGYGRPGPAAFEFMHSPATRIRFGCWTVVSEFESAFVELAASFHYPEAREVVRDAAGGVPLPRGGHVERLFELRQIRLPAGQRVEFSDWAHVAVQEPLF